MCATTIAQLRAAAARALRGSTGSRLARTVLLGVSGGLDPGVEAPLQTLGLWTRLWRARLQLPRVVEDAGAAVVASAGATGGPLGALYRALGAGGFVAARSQVDKWVDGTGRAWQAAETAW